MGTTWQSFIVSVCFTSGICLLCFLLFNTLRTQSAFKNFYQAKRKLSIPFRFRPPQLPGGFFNLAWIKGIFAMPDDKFVCCAGFDALTYCKFFSLAIRITAVPALLCMAVILPLNLTGNGAAENEQEISEFEHTSISNIKQRSMRLWAHSGVIAIVTCTTMWMMNAHWEFAIKWRVLYMARMRKGTTGHTIMLQDIPGTGFGAALKGKKQAQEHKVDASTGEKMTKMANSERYFFKDKSYDVYKHTLGGPREGAERSPNLEGQVWPAAQEYPAPSPLGARRDLAHYEPHPPPTDFEAWRQVASAHGDGVRVVEIVRREFTRDFGPHAVLAVNVVRDCPDLHKLVTEYRKKQAALEDLADTFSTSMRARRMPQREQHTVKVKSDDEEAARKWGIGRSKQDAMEFKLWELDQLYWQIRENEQHAGDKESSSAFVTTRTRLTQSVVTTGLLSYDTDFWHAQPAPQPNDVIWDNVGVRQWRRSVGNAIAWLVWVALVMLFLPVVAVIQSIINLEQYEVSGVDTLLNIPVISGLITGILPTFAFILCLALVPIILKLAASQVAKLPAHSAVDFDVGQKFFLFTYVIVFLGSTVFHSAAATSIRESTSNKSGSGSSYPWDGLISVWSNPQPSVVFQWFGTCVASTGGFFLSFIFAKGLLSAGIKFLKLPKAIIFRLTTKASKSKRAAHRAYSRLYIAYGPIIPYHSTIFLLALTFCVIQPFMPLFAFIYFIVNYFYARYDTLYVLREPYQSGGMYWPVLHQQMYIGLVTFLAVNTGIMITMLFVPGIVIAAICLAATVPYIVMVRSKYSKPMNVLSIHAAADLDRADTKFDWMKDLTPEEEALMTEREWDLEETALGPIEHRYTQPALRVREDEHEKTMGAARLADRLAKNYHEGDDVPTELSEEEYGSDASNGDALVRQSDRHSIDV